MIDKRYCYDLDIEYEWLINEYQITFNSIIVETIGNAEGIEEVYRKLHRLNIDGLSKENYYEYLANEFLYRKLDFMENHNRTISNIIQNLNFGNGTINIYKDKEKLFDYLIGNLYENIKKKLSYYNKSEMLCILYALSSYIAEFSGRVYLVFDNKSVSEDTIPFTKRENKILFVIKNLCKENISEISNIFAADKSIVQLLINILLYDNVESEKKSVKFFNYAELHQLAYSLTYIYNLKKSILSKISGEDWLKVENGRLIFSNDLLNKMKSIVRKSFLRVDEKINLSNDEYIKIFNEFKKINKYSPTDLNKYLICRDKMIKDDRYVQIVNTKILKQDIINITGISEDGADNLIQRFRLNSIPRESIIESIEDEENRIFRRPIIIINDFAIISFPLLYHSVQSFSYRITRKEFGTNKEMDKIIKKKIDEIDLDTIKQLLEKKKIKYMLNEDIFHILGNKSKEIDCAFVYNKIFYLIELKNKKLRFNIKGIINERRDAKNSIDSIIENMEEINKPKNRSLFENYFDEEFETIRPLLVFKRYNPVIDIDFDNKGITFLTFNELMQLLEEIKKKI